MNVSGNLPNEMNDAIKKMETQIISDNFQVKIFISIDFLHEINIVQN